MRKMYFNDVTVFDIAERPYGAETTIYFGDGWEIRQWVKAFERYNNNVKDNMFIYCANFGPLVDGLYTEDGVYKDIALFVEWHKVAGRVFFTLTFMQEEDFEKWLGRKVIDGCYYR